MSISIEINNETCIKCGKCVRVCPADILTQENNQSLIGTQNIHSCIGCGHCVAACPEDSVKHSMFPADKVHEIDYSSYPTPDQMMLLIKSRRSNRAFSKKQVSKEHHDLIIEAGHRAPTGSNMQNVKFMLITDPAKIQEVIDFTMGVFGGMLKKLKNPILKPIIKMAMGDVLRYVPVIEKMKRDYETGEDMILRNATSIIFYYTPVKSRMGHMDANLAYQNSSLMAESLGVSQFYLGFVLNAANMQKGKLEKVLGIDGQITAGMGLGMPSFRFPKYIDKKDIDVTVL